MSEIKLENCNEQVTDFKRKPHLTKDQRFPACFTEASRILLGVKSKKGTVKTLLYKTKLRGKVFKKVYALVYRVLKNIRLIDKIIEDVCLLSKEPYFVKERAEILVHEICFSGGRLPGKSKPVLIIQKYQRCIEESFLKHRSSPEKNLETDYFDPCCVPRYARVHTLLTTVDKVITELKKLGFMQIEYEDNICLDKYHMMVKSLKKKEFVVDFHFKDILAFSSQQSLFGLHLYQNGHIFLHDKSSYIPVHLLSPPPNSIVLDCCAAPGMKTVHLAARMNNMGKIFAIDRDKERFKVLKESLRFGGVKICKTGCADFLDADPKSEPFSSVEYILLDPSCSGSGMISRMDHFLDDLDSNTEGRLNRLAGFQILLLKHALSLPSVKRVVYSTCSIHEQENEYVVHEALQHYYGLFHIIPALPEWPSRGVGDYAFAHLCLRASPQVSLTNGFFVAVFERISQEGQIQYDISEKKSSKDIQEKQDDYKNSLNVNTLDLMVIKKGKNCRLKSSNQFQKYNSHEIERKTRSAEDACVEISADKSFQKDDFVNGKIDCNVSLNNKVSCKSKRSKKHKRKSIGDA